MIDDGAHGKCQSGDDETVSRDSAIYQTEGEKWECEQEGNYAGAFEIGVVLVFPGPDG